MKLIEEVEEFKNKCKQNLNEKAHLEKFNQNETNEIREKLKCWKDDLKILESNEDKRNGIYFILISIIII